MPLSLDFPEITNAFRQFLLLPVRQIAHSFEALALWLGKRVKTADLLEQASRGFPIIRFEGDAVALWLDSLQAGALAPDVPPPGILARLRGAGERFLKGVGRVKEAVQQELILPGAFATFAGAIREIAASIERFAHPPGEMTEQLFGHSGVADNDPQRRTASDLFGEAALAWRSVAGSTFQLRSFVQQVATAKAFLSPAPATGEAGPSDPNALPDMLENTSRLILGGLLVLPALPAFAQSLWESLVIVVKFAALDAFARIEASVNALRKKVLDFFFVDLRTILRKALSYTMATQLVLIVNVRFFTQFALDYAALLVTQLRAYFDEVTAYFNKYIDFINSVLSAIESILQFDLSPIISTVLAPVLGPATLAIPSITVDDLITAGTDVARGTARVTLAALAESINLLVQLNPFIPDAVSRRIDAIPSLIWNALRKPAKLPAETAQIRWPAGYGFPNLYDTIFRPGLPALRSAIDGIARELPEGTRNILGVGSAALDVIGDEFADQAARAAAGGSTERFRRLAETANRQAQAVFGEDVDALHKRIAERRPDAVAQSFEGWLATGGFQLLGLTIPAYFKEMRAYWRDKEAQGQEATVRIDMTSPRILAERALLARATVKHVVINAAGKPVNADLVAEVAAQFQAAVQQAYLDGQARLKLYAVSEYV
jgi:hypothetical protein